MTPKVSKLTGLGIGIVLLHLLVVVPHGIAHSNLHIDMNLWQNVYILVVINLLPLVSAFLIWKRLRSGYSLLLLSMAGSLVFGVIYHFIIQGTDNVANLPPHTWTHTFQLTAVLLAITELAGVMIGLVGWRSTTSRSHN